MQMDIGLMQESARQASRLLAAMANDKRLLILCRLVDGECSVGELAELIGTRQSTVSQHLAILKRDGFVDSKRDGQTQLYALSGDEARRVLEALYGLYCGPAKGSTGVRAR